MYTAWQPHAQLQAPHAQPPVAPTILSPAVSAPEWVLYVELNPANRACAEVIRMVEMHQLNNVLLQDIHAVRGQRPEWLKGVPSLVDTRTKLCYKGSDVMKVLEQLYLAKMTKLMEQQQKLLQMQQAQQMQQMQQIQQLATPAKKMEALFVIDKEELSEKAREKYGEKGKRGGDITEQVSLLQSSRKPPAEPSASVTGKPSAEWFQ